MVGSNIYGRRREKILRFYKQQKDIKIMLQFQKMQAQKGRTKTIT